MITKGREPNAAHRDYGEFENRSLSSPIRLTGGLDLETSKFEVQPGTLQNCLNYEASRKGYRSSRHLRHYDGTFDRGISNCYIVETTNVESTYSTPNMDDIFVLGGKVTWTSNIIPGAPTSEGTCVLVTLDSQDVLGLVDIIGTLPAADDILTDAQTGQTVTLASTLAYPPSELIGRDVGAFKGNTHKDLKRGLAFINQRLSYDYNTSSRRRKGLVPGFGPIVGGFQYDDKVYAARNAYVRAFYDGGTNTSAPIVPGDVVQIPYSSPTSYEYMQVVKVIKNGGDWEDGSASGYLVLAENPSGATNPTVSVKRLDYPQTVDAILNEAGTTIAQVVSYIAGAENENLRPLGSLLYKADITTLTDSGWQPIDTGWSVKFQLGENAPNVANAPLFQDNLVDNSASATNPAAAGSSVVSGTYVAWTSPGNITADDGTGATCALTASPSTSDILKAAFTNSFIPVTDATVTGVEVTVQASFDTAIGTPGKGPKDLMARLTYEGDLGSAQVSLNKAQRAVMTGPSSVVNYVYGGENDLWGLDEITVDQVNDGDWGFEFQVDNDDTNAHTVDVDYIEMTVYYVPKKERLYFYDATAGSDIADGDLVAYQQEGGTFTNGTAAGWFSMDFSDSYNVGVGSIVVGTEIWTDAAGTGTKIGEVAQQPQYNLLPSSNDMINEEAMFRVIKANYFENAEAEAIYAATGAGHAFAYNNDGFHFIRLPLPTGEDKPRHVAFHDNKLALGYKAGFVALSAVGVPNDFNGTTGSAPSLWGVGDRVTGLLPSRNNVLMILSESSVRSLEGSSETTGTLRVVSPTIGAIEYTALNLYEPVFCTNRGVTSITASEKYGDFSIGDMTLQLQDWIQDRIQDVPVAGSAVDNPKCALQVRSRSQYRLYFEDGYILNLFFREDGTVEPTWQHYDTGTTYPPTEQDYVPTWVDSTVLSTGRERMVMGNENGEVYIIDGAEASYLWEDFRTSLLKNSYFIESPRWIVLNPLNLYGAENLSKSPYISIQGLFYGLADVDVWVDENFDFRRYNEASDTTEQIGNATLGDATNKETNTLSYSRPEIIRAYASTLTDGISYKIEVSETKGAPPHYLQSIILRSSTAGVNRNRAHREY